MRHDESLLRGRIVRSRKAANRAARRCAQPEDELSVTPLRPRPLFIAIPVEPRLMQSLPLMSAAAVCGFPSPADDYIEGPLDFNELLIENAPATFVVRVAGDSMTGTRAVPRRPGSHPPQKWRRPVPRGALLDRGIQSRYRRSAPR